jgi:uncharacterized membrane protein
MTPHHVYWRKTLTMTAILLVAWVLLMLASAFYARELRDAAGPLYAAIIALYAWYLSAQDRPDPTG